MPSQMLQRWQQFIMTSKYLYCILLFSITMFGCDNAKTESNIQNVSTSKEITSITIHFNPSFLNQCDLKIVRQTDSAIIIVDSLFLVEYGKLKASVSLKAMEANTDVENFYDTGFLNLNKFDDSKPHVLDGISLLIHYSDGAKIDSVYTGNYLSQNLRMNLKHQIAFLKDQTRDLKLKEYLTILMDYF